MNQPSPENPGPYTADGAYPPGSPRPNVTGRVLGTVGAILALAMVGFGALFLVDLSMSETTTTSHSYDAVGTVELVADGDVTVSAAEGDIEVDAIAHSGMREPTYSEDVSGSRLEVTHRCGWSFLLARCSGELDVTLPAGTEVVVRTENGDVVATGLAGEVSLNTSNGRVEADNISGRLLADSSNGDIDVTDAQDDVETSTSNGEVSVVGVDGTVTAKTSNGRITIDSVTGDASARTSNGSVEVSAVDGNVYSETSNGRITVVGNGEPVALTLETSNGSETIEGPTDPEADRTVVMRSSNGDVAYLDR
jgi:type VI protein secretion system component Hcp